VNGDAEPVCVHRAFERVARLSPESTAVVSAGEKLTYAALDARANFLARHFQQSGIRAGDIVALALPRSIDMVVSMLAILKVGAAYLPLEDANPVARNLVILRVAGVTHIVCRPGGTDALLSGRTAVYVTPQLSGSWLRGFATCDSTPEDKCYVMFTSGSTGDPKGVIVPHRAVLRLVVNTNYIAFRETDTVLQLSPPSFDASTLEFWGPLLNGARLALYSGAVLDPSVLKTEIAAYSVTVLWLTAALFHLVAARLISALEPLRVLLAGGDVLNAKHVSRVLEHFPHLTVINGYGPTENTTFTCCHVMTARNKPSGAVPIGIPITGTQVHILDEALRPVAIGEVGELHASGAGVALGYLAADAEHAFFRDARIAPGLIYRTGDLVRQDAAGVIEFLGRKDTQVKLRGYRISLEEIRLRMAELEGVSDVIVARKVLDSGDQLLVAYVQPQEGVRLSVAQVKEKLSEVLPDYMIPDQLVMSAELPITISGKLDRRAILGANAARAASRAIQ
jgi:amino acid adenylation domain-containing protein